MGKTLDTIALVILVLGMLPTQVLCQEIKSVRVEGDLPSYFDAEQAKAIISFWLLQPPVSTAEQTLKLVLEVTSDRFGQYQAEGLPSGQYLIECSTPYFGSESTWRNLYSPSGAPVIVDFLDLKGRFPNQGLPLTLKGKVLLPDGSPATRATVTVTSPYNPCDAVQVHTDGSGQFTVTVAHDMFAFNSIVYAFDETHRPAAVVAGSDELTQGSVTLTLGNDSLSSRSEQKEGN